MKHKLYLYLDNFSFSDYYATQCIACEAFMPNKKGSRTISRGTENFLFLTHIKADTTSRHAGITDQLISWPVTLECVLDDEIIENFPVVFLHKSDDQRLERGDIKDYDADKHVGCFAFAEIPFSTVTKIFFENEDQLIDSDKSIFPDFMWEEIYTSFCPPLLYQPPKAAVRSSAALCLFKTVTYMRSVVLTEL